VSQEDDIWPPPERAHESIVQHGGLDADGFGKLIGLLRYVDGDYTDPATFEALRKVARSASPLPDSQEREGFRKS
jgi:hypothetical protein